MAGIILCMRPATDRQCYNVTLSLIGWAHTQNWNFEWNLISEMGQCYKVWLKGKLATYRRHVSRGTIILAELGAEVTKMLTTNYWDHQQNKNIILQKLLVFIMAKFACVNYKTQGLLCIKNTVGLSRRVTQGWLSITIYGTKLQHWGMEKEKSISVDKDVLIWLMNVYGLCWESWQENIKVMHYWPFVRGTTGNQWIPLTKGQYW